MPQIPYETIRRQRLASDPKNSVWVSANAGSGKTHVLAQRVLRLLLSGTAPGKILCLTFTKAAAANMSARVFDQLAEWTRLNDPDLRAAIEAIGADVVSQHQLTLARRLFARSVETPGGLKIQTIHAFCEKLLHLFPFEANVPARFDVLEEYLQAELLQRARREILTNAQTHSNEQSAHLQKLTDECDINGFVKLIDQALSKRAIFENLLPTEREAVFRKVLGLAPDVDRPLLERAKVEGILDPSRWGQIADFLAQGLATDIKRAGKLRKSTKFWNEKADWFTTYFSVFFNQDNEPQKKLVTKDLASKSKELAEQIESELRNEQQRLVQYLEKQKSFATLERSLALVNLSGSIFKRYEELKLARGVLDFEDLINKTLELVTRSDARWVLYKLDSGIDHILVDEAQDTSEAQWKILEALTEDFPYANKELDSRRSFFAVGDEKQSIFSFQGAAPHMFEGMRRQFNSKFSSAETKFEYVRLTHSFRSVPCILKAVDKVFESAVNQKGVVTDYDLYMPHEAIKDHLPGLVEIWPLICHSYGNERPRDWTMPLDALDSQDPASLLASRISVKIKELIKSNQSEFVFDGETERFRPIRPGDILVLVRSRGPFFSALIRALKQLQVPVAGADRLDVFQHIAIMDLIALGRSLLLPQDDLTFACVLKSPLIGLHDDDLIALAPLRSASLFEALAASTEPRHVAALEKFLQWQKRLHMTPFNFYARLLGQDGGRRDLVSRLGPEAADAIDEFLALAMDHQRRKPSSLGVFLAELEDLEISIRRDMESGRDLVRVMTVHAAKGLEAKIVFLPDTCSAPSRNRSPEIFAVSRNSADPPIIAWSPNKEADCQVLSEARKKARELEADEHRRLLYVALTRAEERLYIGSFYGSANAPEGCWSKMIEAALPKEEMRQVPAFWGETEFILRREWPENLNGWNPVGTPERQANLLNSGRPEQTPTWLFAKAAEEELDPKPVHPSNALMPSPQQGEGSASNYEREKALQTGKLAHALMQFLPNVAVTNRRSAAASFLDHYAADLEPLEKIALIKQTNAILEWTELAPLFAPGSRAEVAIFGKVSAAFGKEISVSGKVDRIAETADTVYFADYKYGILFDSEVTPRSYVLQMALYRAVLVKLWPKKQLKALLVWLSGPRIVELTDRQMDLALLDLDLTSEP